jgi:hypothetical protein
MVSSKSALSGNSCELTVERLLDSDKAHLHALLSISQKMKQSLVEDSPMGKGWPLHQHLLKEKRRRWQLHMGYLPPHPPPITSPPLGHSDQSRLTKTPTHIQHMQVPFLKAVASYIIQRLYVLTKACKKGPICLKEI